MARKPEILILDDDDELDENNDVMDCNNMYLGEDVTLVTLMNEIADSEYFSINFNFRK